MKPQKPASIKIRTPFWTASVPVAVLVITVASFVLIVGLLYAVFHYLWIAFLSTSVGFAAFIFLMPKPTPDPEDGDQTMAGAGTRNTPKKTAPAAHKRQKSGRK
jgi:hypothetical protein